LKAFTSCPWARHKAGIAIAIYFAHAALAELGRDAAVRDAFADHLFNRNFRFGFPYRALYTRTASAGAGLSTSRPTMVSMVNSATSWDRAASAAWVTIFGGNLAPATHTLQASEIVNGKLPETLEGVSVSINNKPAFLSLPLLRFLGSLLLGAVSTEDAQHSVIALVTRVFVHRPLGPGHGNR